MAWVLVLNDMRSSNVEIVQPVCRAESKEALQAFINRERAPESYRDGSWAKTFKHGSILEWFNPPWNDCESFQDVGQESDWVQRAIQNYSRNVLGLPAV